MSEIRRALQGSWRLAHGDPSGLACFDRTEAALWRSFRAAILVAPAYLLQLWMQYTVAPPTAGPLRVAAVAMIIYTIGWFAFPVIMHPVCRLLGREQAFVGYIVAYNWSALVVSYVWFPGVLLASLLFGTAGWVAGQGALLLYQWYIARTALSVTGLTAAAIALFDFTLSFALGELADSMV